MNLKSAQIKRVFYPDNPGGRDLIVLSDYDDEVQRILQSAADRAVQWLKYNVPYSYIPAAIQAESSLRAYILAGKVKE